MARQLERLAPGWREGGLVIACSGGVDSMALLHAFDALGGHAVVAHFHHGLRGDEADGDAALVEKVAKRVGWDFVRGERAGSATSESALRRERRKFLREVRRDSGAKFILTAHHFDDNLETVLMRLVRGTGLKGLGAMRPKLGPWLKPLLDVSRSEIEAYARTHGVIFREDATNREGIYFRNRVRQRLIPIVRELADEFGGAEGLRERLTGLLADVRWAGRELKRKSLRLEKKIVTRSEFFYRLDRTELDRAPGVVRRALVLRLLGELTDGEFSRRDIDRVLSVGGGAVRGNILASGSMGFLYLQNGDQRERLRVWELGGGSIRPGDRLKGSGKKVSRFLQELRIPRLERRLVQIRRDEATSDVIGMRLSDISNAPYKELNFP
ncbi:MAG: tRNA lysidine(34) synthetase TilS [Deltaproteobacteria bacterium]|nr:tRNA lysidine(34) synthetase TilS [Deltaproteobacteria bacterium]MBI3294478.1 tRNA lysidine(34) synthetase TilS [Deltaproteobacteria bacterium]